MADVDPGTGAGGTGDIDPNISGGAGGGGGGTQVGAGGGAGGPDGGSGDAGGGAGDAAGGAAGGGAGGDAAFAWPENWRQELAAGDPKELERLSRMDHPGRVYQSYRELEAKLAQADIRTPFPDEGSDEDKAAWRDKNGIPAQAGDYFNALPDGVEIPEGDREGYNLLAERMQAANQGPEAFNVAMTTFQEFMTEQHTAQAEQDIIDRQETEDAISTLYGPEMRGNMNKLKAWLEAGGVYDGLMQSRMPDGRALANSPELVEFLVGQMHVINPAVTLTDLADGDPGVAIETEIKDIERVMSEDFRKYSADKVMQARYTELLSARSRLTGS